MESGIKTKRLRIGGMTCVNCENKIEKKLRNTAGVQSVKVSYGAGSVDIAYDADVISLKDIRAVIERLDYRVLAEKESRASDKGRIAGLLLIIAALYFLMQQFGVLNLLVPSRLAEANMGYGMLFVIGLLTSVHCVAMCGGINLSQCMPRVEARGDEGRLAALRPTFLYNLGRVISYTAVGFIVGALGSVITFSNAMQGGLKLVAGLFMVVMGMNMLGIFPWLRRLNPRMPRFFARKISAEKGKSKSPLIVGLLNGLMPCGPLQAMQIYALSTGNPLSGALSMFLFSVGTVPLMFGLGALGSVLSKKFTHRIMTAGAVLVAVLGLSMFSQGWSLAGFALPELIPQDATAQSAASDGSIEKGVQVVNSTLAGGRYPNITVQAGTPVKWIIDAPQGSINGCNNRMFINEYGIEYTFKTGENIIEFTPTKAGSVRYNCWMGMIRGTITVIEAGAKVPDAPDAAGNAWTIAAPDAANPVPSGYAIPTDGVAVATLSADGNGDFQEVRIDLTDQGFSPAILVVQAGLDVQWNIVNQASGAAGGTQLLIPAYYAQLALSEGDNPLYFSPSESFDFSTGDNAFYGYVKVVSSLDEVDLDAIRAEVSAIETLAYPPDYFQSPGGGSCCQ